WLVRLLVDGSFAVADTIRALPWMAWRRPTPGAAIPSLYYLGLAVLVKSLSHRGPSRPATTATALAIVGGTRAILVAPVDTGDAPDGLRVTMIDVGQGDAILIETPRRGRLLVDAGGSPRGEFDVGERVVSPALWRAGIARLDLVAVTHD